MILRRIFGIVLVAGMAASGETIHAQAIAPMARDAHPVFDVATIRLSDPSSTNEGVYTIGRQVRARHQTLKNLMVFAYGVHENQIVGGPGWMAEDRYDVDGVADVEGNPNVVQMREMFRRLLAERFGLTFHHDKKELAYFGAVVAKGGPKLKDTVAAPDARPDFNVSGNNTEREMKFTGTRMPDFVQGMDFMLDKPVVDETGLSGRYDFTLKWKRDSAPAGEADGPPVLFTAIQEELGLKLEAKKGMLDVVVVDKVGRPSAN